jgi:hypothetical protein
MDIPAAFQEVASFNFRHSIGPSFGLRERLFDMLRAGDALVVRRVDRLGRNGRTSPRRLA